MIMICLEFRIYVFRIINITCYEVHRFLDINQVFSPVNFQFGDNNVHYSLYMMRCPQYKKTSKDSHCKKVENEINNQTKLDTT